MHDQSWFVTLTYDDKHLPEDHSLCLSDFQYFLKALRRAAGVRRVNPSTGRKKNYPARIRYFACGEYGSRTLRPHYHALLFGLRLPDLVDWRRGAAGDRIFRSELLTNTWGRGHVEVGGVTPRSAAYVAGYILKKNTEPLSDDIRYRRTDFDTGETWLVKPEFHTMSLKPGIGTRFFEKYSSELITHAAVVLDGGSRNQLPRYYRELLSRTNLPAACLVEDKVYARFLESDPLESSPERLAVRETVAMAKLKLKSRSL